MRVYQEHLDGGRNGRGSSVFPRVLMLMSARSSLFESQPGRSLEIPDLGGSGARCDAAALMNPAMGLITPCPLSSPLQA